MEQQRHIYHKATSAKPPLQQTTPQPPEEPKKPRKKSKTVALVVCVVLASLYLFATAFCAIKFNSLNPIRTGWGILQVVGGNATYQQIASIPYDAYVAGPQNSEQNLIAMMQEKGYQYEETESLGGALIFSKDGARLRVVLSGNAYFTRWVFSEEIPITTSSQSMEATQ